MLFLLKIVVVFLLELRWFDQEPLKLKKTFLLSLLGTEPALYFKKNLKAIFNVLTFLYYYCWKLLSFLLNFPGVIRSCKKTVQRFRFRFVPFTWLLGTRSMPKICLSRSSLPIRPKTDRPQCGDLCIILLPAEMPRCRFSAHLGGLILVLSSKTFFELSWSDLLIWWAWNCFFLQLMIWYGTVNPNYCPWVLHFMFSPDGWEL